jgi:translation elongation factor EF-Ts
MNRKKTANINELFKKPNNDNYDDGSEALCSQESLESSKKHLEDWCEEQIRRYGDKSVWGNYATEEAIKPALLNRIRSAQHKDIRTKDNATNYAWRVAMAKFAMHLADRYGIDLDNEWSLVNEELKKNRKMNMKVIKISESKFHNIVKKIVNESVNRILKESNINEYPYSPYKEGSPEDNEWSQKTFTNNTSRYWKAKHPEWDDEK